MSETLAEVLRSQLQACADPEKAQAMQAYMKTSQPFSGVDAPTRKRLFSAAKKQFPLKTFADYSDNVLELWHGVTREEMYMGLAVAESYKKFRTDLAMPLFEEMVFTANNWDTLDLVASKLIGDLVKSNREHEKKLVQWRDNDNFWVRRAAILAHLKHKSDTNVNLLAQTILLLAHEKEFFIRKAIGWVLREYAKTDANWVAQFVAQHQAQLSPLSKKEALKHIQQ